MMNRKLLIAAAAAVLVGGPVAVTMYAGEVAAQGVLRMERELTPPEAAQVAQRMNLTVDEAVRQGLMERLRNGNYLVTESGAALLAANGVPVSAFAGATPLQITGMIALALGLTVIGESLVDDDSPPVVTATPTPTIAPTPTPSPTVAPTPPPTPTPVPTPTPTGGGTTGGTTGTTTGATTGATTGITTGSTTGVAGGGMTSGGVGSGYTGGTGTGGI